MVEISKAFEYEDFTAFDRKRFPKVYTTAYRVANLNCLLAQSILVRKLERAFHRLLHMSSQILDSLKPKQGRQRRCRRPVFADKVCGHDAI